MNIVKFGTIREAECGTLVFDGFCIDCEMAGKSPEECLLELIIERLERELAEVRDMQRAHDAHTEKLAGAIRD